MSKRVFVAMSGGVDSSIAAYLLKKEGFEVAGIHLELFSNLKPAPEPEHADLERTCRLIDIPLHYLHLETEFKRQVIEYFCEEYDKGRTPNPCIRCNKFIKFGLLLEKMGEIGGDCLATGHYARIEISNGKYRLLKGVDSSKDQSYFLYRLGQKELTSILFPLGGMHKSEVKHLAATLGLPATTRPESQDICFIPDNDSHAFIADHSATRPGEIIDTQGNVLGQHRGLAHYTIGQRQGLGISSRKPLYVIHLDSEANRLVVGLQEQLFKNKLIAYNLNWISGKPPEGTIDVGAKVRYRSPEAKASLRVQDEQAEVCFEKPQRALAPGQSAVFYQDDLMLGGGIIGETA